MRTLIPLIAILLSGMAYADTKSGLHDTGLICAVDMGSNTFKFIVAEIKNGEYHQYVDVRKTAGVGDDLENSEKKSGKKNISDVKQTEIKLLLKEFQDECERRTQSRKLYAIATAAFREAENVGAISQQINHQGIELEVLTGRDRSNLCL